MQSKQLNLVFIKPTLQCFKKKFMKASMGLFIKYVRKVFRKTNVHFLPPDMLIRTRTCTYQGVSVSFLENFPLVLNE